MFFIKFADIVFISNNITFVTMSELYQIFGIREKR
jgi:hypothetical protein